MSAPVIKIVSRWDSARVLYEHETTAERQASGLAGISDAALTYALDHLPADKPPTSTQFRHLCLSYRQEVPALPPPKPDPEVARAVVRAFQRPESFGPKAWAERLRDREADGDRLSAVQRRFWREALQHEGAAQ